MVLARQSFSRNAPPSAPIAARIGICMRIGCKTWPAPPRLAPLVPCNSAAKSAKISGLKAISNRAERSKRSRTAPAACSCAAPTPASRKTLASPRSKSCASCTASNTARVPTCRAARARHPRKQSRSRAPPVGASATPLNERRQRLSALVGCPPAARRSSLAEPTVASQVALHGTPRAAVVLELAGGRWQVAAGPCCCHAKICCRRALCRRASAAAQICCASRLSSATSAGPGELVRNCQLPPLPAPANGGRLPLTARLRLS
jgi:hypothetical protein